MKVWKRNTLTGMGIFLTFFGLLTLFVGTSVLADRFGMREIEGNYIPFVVLANLSCALLYLISAYGLFRRQKWAVTVLWIALTILIITFIAVYFYIQSGGIYEQHMLRAMTLRTSLTFLMAISTYFLLQKR